jgi:diaminohydroxyphosphoribosylaminopyrimidine deaminase/5-amino-6-(5-phosphoribosylamino)uracil reductase
MNRSTDDSRYMARALELAAQGQGRVEPNPMVGAVVVQGDRIVGEGWHQQFGGPHAEIEALRAAGEDARGATLYVTLEPCCHVGKTPPCTEAILRAGISRVVFALGDPFEQVRGGAEALRAAGVAVCDGVLAEPAAELCAPYLKLVTRQRPWIIAKWAMTLDGKIATSTGESRWISSDTSRRLAHALRGRVDAVVVGGRTALVDDPLLTARPPGARIATRIVLDSEAKLPLTGQLVRTARAAPLLVVVDRQAPAERRTKLTEAGAEVLVCTSESRGERLDRLWKELGRRRMTNVMVEGGSTLLGAIFDADQVDEVHVFIAPKLIGGTGAPSPLGGQGLPEIAMARRLASVKVDYPAGDIYIQGRIVRDDTC